MRVACSLVVDGYIGAHALTDELVLDEVPHQPAPLLHGKLNRQADLDFPGQLRILGFLHLLH